MAYEPVNTPVLSLTSSVRSRSLLAAARVQYAVTALLLRRQSSVARRTDAPARSPCRWRRRACRGAWCRCAAHPRRPCAGTRSAAAPRATRHSPPARPMKKSTSAPVLRPIQSLCSFLMLSGQLSRCQIVFQSIRVGRDAQHPLAQRPPLDRVTAPLALAVDHLLVGQHRAQGRAPVDQRFGLIGQTMLVLIASHGRRALPRPPPRESAAPQSGGPAFCCGSNHVSNSTRKIHWVHRTYVDVRRGQLPIPVVAESQHLQLPPERGDVALGRFARRRVRADRMFLGRQTRTRRSRSDAARSCPACVRSGHTMSVAV